LKINDDEYVYTFICGEEVVVSEYEMNLYMEMGETEACNDRCPKDFDDVFDCPYYQQYRDWDKGIRGTK